MGSGVTGTEGSSGEGLVSGERTKLRLFRRSACWCLYEIRPRSSLVLHCGGSPLVWNPHLLSRQQYVQGCRFMMRVEVCFLLSSHLLLLLSQGGRVRHR